MRISHKYKFIFLSKYKCASTSIRAALEPFSDIISCQRYPYYHHTSAKALKAHFDSVGWDWHSYYSFITIRNPWSMVVSLYYYGLPDKDGKLWWHRHWEDVVDDKYYKHQRAAPENAICFDDWICSFNFKPFTLSHFIEDNGVSLVNDIFKFEEIEKVGVISSRLNLPSGFSIPHRNITQRPNESLSYTKKTRDMVGDIFISDVKAGNYMPPPLHGVWKTAWNRIRSLNRKATSSKT